MTRKPIGVTAPYRKDEKAGAVAYIHRNEYNEYRLEPSDDFKVTSLPLNTEVPLYTSEQINAKLEAMAVECERMPFGDTGASFAAWIRGHKL